MQIRGNEIFVAEYFSESIGKVKLDENGNAIEIRSELLLAKTPMSEERQGEIYFNDASLCFQQWQSCASCHTDDGRVDARVGYPGFEGRFEHDFPFRQPAFQRGRIQPRGAQ